MKNSGETDNLAYIVEYTLVNTSALVILHALPIL